MPDLINNFLLINYQRKINCNSIRGPTPNGVNFCENEIESESDAEGRALTGETAFFLAFFNVPFPQAHIVQNAPSRID